LHDTTLNQQRHGMQPTHHTAGEFNHEMHEPHEKILNAK
jgi:hypothetical protein